MKIFNLLFRLKYFTRLVTLFVFIMIASTCMAQGEPTSEATPIEKPFLFWGTIAVIALGLYLFAKYRSSDRTLKREIKKTRKVSIQDFVDGQTSKVVGKVVSGEKILRAPLSGKECVFYHLIIEKMEKNLEAESFSLIPSVVVDEKVSGEFFISDNTGFAKINPENAYVYLVKDTNNRANIFKGPDELITQMLEERGLGSKSLLDKDNPYTLKEGILEIGEEVAISGQGYWGETIDPQHTNNLAKSLIFKHSEQTPLKISDDPSTF